MSKVCNTKHVLLEFLYLFPTRSAKKPKIGEELANNWCVGQRQKINTKNRKEKKKSKMFQKLNHNVWLQHGQVLTIVKVQKPCGSDQNMYSMHPKPLVFLSCCSEELCCLIILQSRNDNTPQFQFQAWTLAGRCWKTSISIPFTEPQNWETNQQTEGVLTVAK